ncbi:MAG: TorF family putative porin [Gammaproteobacteria bacterium]|jgi:uncharacterized protein (TIGR02001 family)
MTMFTANKLTRYGLTTAVAGMMVAAPMLASAGVTGNIGVFSDYVLRGINGPGGTEGDGPVVQGGFDYSGDSGIYAGYWGSNLGYSNGSTARGFENDFYAGWGGSSGGFNYSIGFIQYYYLHVSNSDGLEINPTVGYGPVTFGLKYLVEDVAWGNGGDIYWTLGYSTALPADFSLSATLGYYTYEGSGKYIASSKESSAFRHLDLALSHPIGKTGADMSVTYTLPGKDRNGTDQKDAIVLGVSYGFDI